MGFEDEDINKLYAIHSKYEKPMKMRQEISEIRTQVNYLNDEMIKNAEEIETL